MISKRRLVAAAATGAGAVLLATGTAFACNINDFSVDATARCDTSTGTPKAAITVTDKDGSGTPADITVYWRLADNAPNGVAGTGHIEHPTAAGVSTTVLVDWQQGYSWIVSITAGDVIHDQQLEVQPRSEDTPCEVPATATPSATPATSSPMPSDKPAKARPVAVPSSAAPSASPASGKTLAETGGGRGTGLIAGTAAALVALGGGMLFFLRRRGEAGRH